MSYERHYARHLARVYTWMFGDFERMVHAQKEFFEQHSVFPRASRVALDLGCGSGFQSVALSRLGFSVVAVDTSPELLDELKTREAAVQTFQRDLRDLSFARDLRPELIVCMGDTLTHLDSLDEVRSIVQQSYELLQPGGKLILTFRDLSNAPRELDRFILVRAEAKRILTCFLEDEGEKVRVFDLLHEKTGETWTLTKSFYRKIKLPLDQVKAALLASGFSAETGGLKNGMSAVIGQKKLPPAGAP